MTRPGNRVWNTRNLTSLGGDLNRWIDDGCIFKTKTFLVLCRFSQPDKTFTCAFTHHTTACYHMSKGGLLSFSWQGVCTLEVSVVIPWDAKRSSEMLQKRVKKGQQLQVGSTVQNIKDTFRQELPREIPGVRVP